MQTLLVDFGSTFTKVALVDIEEGRLLATSQAATTLESVMDGLESAISSLDRPVHLNRVPIRASSSAAGGLHIVAIGLVPELTAEAARKAALGAGARVDKVYSYEIDKQDLQEIEDLAPDMILLAGGTDGGNRKVIEENARRLSALRSPAPILFAGNRSARETVCSILGAAGRDVIVTENVLAGIERLNIDPVREAIRQLFMQRITKANGIDAAEALAGNVIMPTPMAVLEASRLLAQGAHGEEGMGPVVVIDIGGATTDVHSIAPNLPADDAVILKGLEEPVAKRTVEGDLGIRINAAHIVKTHGTARIQAAAPENTSIEARALETRVASGGSTPACLPAESDIAIDAALARTAVETSVERHIGRIEVVYTTQGKVLVQYGKSLACCRTVIGTGGVFAHGPHSRHILSGARGNRDEAISLRPADPDYMVDRSYLLFAGGLLGRDAPAAAVRLLKRHLERVH